MYFLFYEDGPLSTGIEEIDGDHYMLDRMGKDLVTFLNRYHSPAEQQQAFESYIAAMTGHFEREEKYLAYLMPVRAAAHREAHRRLIRFFKTTAITYKRAGGNADSLTYEAVDDLLLRHIIDYDLDYRFLRNKIKAGEARDEALSA